MLFGTLQFTLAIRYSLLIIFKIEDLNIPVLHVEKYAKGDVGNSLYLFIYLFKRNFQKIKPKQ